MSDYFWASSQEFPELLPRHSSIERMSFGAGAAVIERLGENVIRVELSGKVGTELGDSFMAAVARELKKLGTFQIFLDLEKLDEYPSSLRQRAVEFLKRDPAKLIAAHGLAGTRIVNMALSVANLALEGKLSIHADRLRYEIALRDAVRGVVTTSVYAELGC